MALDTQTEIRLNREQYAIRNFESLTVEQQIGDHHNLKLVCRTEDILTSQNTSNKIEKDTILGVTKKYIGTPIIVTIMPRDTKRNEDVGTAFEFSGIIIDIEEEWPDHGVGGITTFYAKSSTILADKSVRHTSYVDQG